MSGFLRGRPTPTQSFYFYMANFQVGIPVIAGSLCRYKHLCSIKTMYIEHTGESKSVQRMQVFNVQKVYSYIYQDDEEWKSAQCTDVVFQVINCKQKCPMYKCVHCANFFHVQSSPMYRLRHKNKLSRVFFAENIYHVEAGIASSKKNRKIQLTVS